MAYNWKKFLHGLENTGLALADTALSAVGATNVIKPEMYIGENKEKYAKAGDIGGGVTQAVAPLALNIVAPGSGTILSGVQKGVQKIGEQTSNTNQETSTNLGDTFLKGQEAYGNFKDMQNMKNTYDVISGMSSLPMPYGGMVPNGTPELEKQEVLRTPQGQIRQVNAPTHSQGGTGPMNLPGGTNVLSDRLKAKSGKTFAEEGAKYNTSKWEKILEKSNDAFQKKTAERMIAFANKQMTKLFAEQELMKGNQMAKKMNKMQKEEMHQMPDGTMMANNQMGKGGTIKYSHGGTHDPIYMTGDQPITSYVPSILGNEGSVSLFPNGMPTTPEEEAAAKANMQQQIYNWGTFQQPGYNMPAGYEQYNNQLANPELVAPNTKSNPFLDKVKDKLAQTNPYFTAATVGNFIGPAYDIYRGARGADEVNFDRVNPELVDFSKAREMGVQETNRGFNATRKAIQEGTAGNAGAYLTNVGAASVQRDRANQNMISQSFENEQNMNAQIRNQAQSQNAGIQQAESTARQMEKDIAKNTLAKGLYNFGASLNQYGTDMSLKGNEPVLKALINTGDYEYVYAKNGKPIGIKSNISKKVTGFTGLDKQRQKELEELMSNLPK